MNLRNAFFGMKAEISRENSLSGSIFLASAFCVFFQHFFFLSAQAFNAVLGDFLKDPIDLRRFLLLSAGILLRAFSGPGRYDRFGVFI